MLLLASEGFTDKQIAKHLNVSPRTIGTYWERMRQKIGPFSRTQLVARLLRSSDGEAPDIDRYRNLFASWEEGVWILEADGRTIYANPRIAELFGTTPEAFAGKDASALLEQTTSSTLSALLEAAGHAAHKVEFRLNRTEAAPLWLTMRATIVRDRRGEVTGIILLLTDVSLHKRVRRTLDACESTLSFMSDHVSDPVSQFDGVGRCVAVNAAFCACTGREESEVVTQPIQALPSVFMPVDRWREALEAAISTGEVQTFPSGLGKLQRGMVTHVIPVPTEEIQAARAICLTTLANGESSSPRK